MSTSSPTSSTALITREEGCPQRALREVRIEADYVVTGGGMTGFCSAVAAARAGLKTVLIHDRPLPGGNASGEIRLWVLGATVHMGTNIRWAREGGVIGEILIENLWRNREGNPVIFDALLLEMAAAEPNLTLLLNTAAFDVVKHPEDPDRIRAVRAFNSQNSTLYHCAAPLFCDASGDGIIGFLSGAAFRMGAEPKDEFGEKFAPAGEFGSLLGHSIYFYSRNTGQPVRFIPPSFALKNIEQAIPRHHQFNAEKHGCTLWWIEYGGRLDTVHETETIKWELWKIVYGVWNYIKNSGKFPEAENLTLDWVGMIPGKRESRRFEGDYILRQQDVVGRAQFPDAVGYGGWSIDLHPADGVYSPVAGSHHLQSKGVYTIPFRCLYSRNIRNLFIAGRIASSSHVAFGSTRVMATCALGGQAAAAAAVICAEKGLLPRDLLAPDRMRDLQQSLLRLGHHIPGLAVQDPEDLAPAAAVSVSSEFRLAGLPANGPLRKADVNLAQMFPLEKGPIPAMTFRARIARPTVIEVELRTTSDGLHHCPDQTLGTLSIKAAPGEDVPVRIQPDFPMPASRYLFVIFKRNPDVELRLSEFRVTGILSVAQRDEGPHDYTAAGGECFDNFTPERRPEGRNLACEIEPPIRCFNPSQILNGINRPTHAANAWVASPDDPEPAVTLKWPEPVTLRELVLNFDADFDHPMESVLWGHPENAVPFCVKKFEVLDGAGQPLHAADDHHHDRVVIRFAQPVTTASITVRLLETRGAPAALFGIRAR